MTKRWTFTGFFLLAGCTMIQATGNRATLVLKPQITSGSYGTQAQVTPYTQASIHHLILNLFTFDGTEHDQGINKTISNADLGYSIVFNNLKPNLTYRIKAAAYSSESVLISTTDSASFTDVLIDNNDRPTLTALKVKLIDSPFNGQATSSGVVVTTGGLFLCRF